MISAAVRLRYKISPGAFFCTATASHSIETESQPENTEGLPGDRWFHLSVKTSMSPLLRYWCILKFLLKYSAFKRLPYTNRSLGISRSLLICHRGFFFFVSLASKCFVTSVLAGEDKTKGAHAAGVQSTNNHISKRNVFRHLNLHNTLCRCHATHSFCFTNLHFSEASVPFVK